MDRNQSTTLNPKKNKKPLLIPFIIVLAGALLLVITLFLPFASATEDYKDRLQSRPNIMYVEEIGMTNEDAVDISLFEFAMIYAVASSSGSNQAVAITCLVFISLFAVFIALTTAFAALKKPIATIIFNIISFCLFLLIQWDFEDRGVLPNRNYDCGCAEYFCYIGFVLVIVGAVLLLIAKIKCKRQLNQQCNEVSEQINEVSEQINEVSEQIL